MMVIRIPALALIAFAGLLGGSFCTKPDARLKTVLSEQANMPLDRDLITLITEASEGEGNEASVEKLKTLPRPELIRALNRISIALAEDDALRVRIAFVSSWLGIDYEKNRQILVESLTKKPKYEKFWADQSASLISGLLRSKSDSVLLDALFASVDWSDGALSEELAVTLRYQAEVDTNAFLTRLAPQPRPRRRRVYSLIRASSSSGDKLKPIKENLARISERSPLNKIAKEMITAISETSDQ